MPRLADKGILPRQMKYKWYREDQFQRRYEEHVAPINHLVDELAEIGCIPYIAPIYGGKSARILSILSDPGRKADESGFLSIENNDATAERMYQILDLTGIDPENMMPWNAYPWFINRKPTFEELEGGLTPLCRLIALTRDLRVVLLHGGTAHRSWDLLAERHKDLIRELKIEVIDTYHTGSQAFRHEVVAVREARAQHIHNALRMAALILREGEPPLEGEIRDSWRSLHGQQDVAGEERWFGRFLGARDSSYRHKLAETRQVSSNGGVAEPGHLIADRIFYKALPNNHFRGGSYRFRVWDCIRSKGLLNNAAIALELSLDIRIVRDCTKKLCDDGKAAPG